GNNYLVFDTPGNAGNPISTLTLGTDLDSVVVGATTGPLTIAGSAGAAVNLGNGTVANIHGDVTITNPFAAVMVDDNADADSKTATLNARAITGLAPATIAYARNPLGLVGSLDVKVGSGGVTLTVVQTPQAPVNIITGSGADTVNVRTTTGPLTITGDGAANW